MYVYIDMLLKCKTCEEQLTPPRKNVLFFKSSKTILKKTVKKHQTSNKMIMKKVKVMNKMKLKKNQNREHDQLEKINFQTVK